MREVDSKEMVDWLERQLKAEQACLAYYEHNFPNETYIAWADRSKLEIARLEKRIAMWKEMP